MTSEDGSLIEIEAGFKNNGYTAATGNLADLRVWNVELRQEKTVR